MPLISQEKLCSGWFSSWELSCSHSMRRSSLPLSRMVSVLFREALVFSLSIASWLQCRSLRLPPQILYPSSADFLACTTGRWAFLVQILDMDLHKTLLRACRGHCSGSQDIGWILWLSSTLLYLTFWVTIIRYSYKFIFPIENPHYNTVDYFPLFLCDYVLHFSMG